MDLKSKIEQFRIQGFAQTYFSKQTSGLFRKKVPIEQMLKYQKVIYLIKKDPINSPILVLSKHLHKEAIKSFKILLRVMSGYSIPIKDFVIDLIELSRIGIVTGALRDELYIQVCKVIICYFIIASYK